MIRIIVQICLITCLGVSSLLASGYAHHILYEDRTHQLVFPIEINQNLVSPIIARFESSGPKIANASLCLAGISDCPQGPNFTASLGELLRHQERRVQEKGENVYLIRETYRVESIRALFFFDDLIEESSPPPLPLAAELLGDTFQVTFNFAVDQQGILIFDPENAIVRLTHFNKNALRIRFRNTHSDFILKDERGREITVPIYLDPLFAHGRSLPLFLVPNSQTIIRIQPSLPNTEGALIDPGPPWGPTGIF